MFEYFSDIELYGSLDNITMQISHWADFEKCETLFKKTVRDFFKHCGEPNTYQTMIDRAIKRNDLIALSTLWQGIYYYGNDVPNYKRDLFTAARHANITTFHHVFWTFLNFQPTTELDMDKIGKVANKEVKEVIEYMILHTLLGFR